MHLPVGSGEVVDVINHDNLLIVAVNTTLRLPSPVWYLSVQKITI